MKNNLTILLEKDINNSIKLSSNEKAIIKNFIKDITPEFNKVVKYLDNFFKDYYKDDTSKELSYDIIISKDIKKIINNTNYIKLKNRFALNRINNNYIKSKNHNFLHYSDGLKSLSYNGANRLYNSLLISLFKHCISTEEFKRGLDLKTYTHYYIDNNFRFSDTLYNFKQSISNTIINEDIINNVTPYIVAVIYSPEHEKNSQTNWNEHVLINLKKLINLSCENVSFSTFINETFDIHDLLNYKINELSVPKKERFINPYSNLTYFKTKRILKEESKENQTILDKYVEEFNLLRSTFELFNDYLKKLEISKTNNIFIVRGELIRYFYNQSNYNGSIYYDSLKPELNITESTGTLWNSCMRYNDERNHREGTVDFYTQNPEVIGLLICKKSELNTLSGRAVIYYNEKEQKCYVDRIFYQTEKDYLSIINYIENNPTFISFSKHEFEKLKDKDKTSYFTTNIYPKYNKHTMPYLDNISSYYHIDKNSIKVGKPNTNNKISKIETSMTGIYNEKEHLPFVSYKTNSIRKDFILFKNIYPEAVGILRAYKNENQIKSKF